MWILDLGQEEYQKVYKLQKEIVQAKIQKKIPDVLVLVQHPPVITIGRGGGNHNLLISPTALEKEGIHLAKIDRGGDITYHGPGQLVGYPIMDLTQQERDLHLLLRNYEEVFIRLLADYAIQGRRIKGLTGVWVGDEKILAIGVGVKRWISFHGFAFNINPNHKHFAFIHPCGLVDKGVTSLTKLLGPVDKDEIQAKVIKLFGQIFQVQLEPIPLDRLLQEVKRNGDD